jgi:hypothetical protein
MLYIFYFNPAAKSFNFMQSYFFFVFAFSFHVENIESLISCFELICILMKYLILFFLIQSTKTFREVIELSMKNKCGYEIS